MAHIGEYEVDGVETYGSADAIFRSLRTLGARFVRQPGYDDLIPLEDWAPLPDAPDIKSYVQDKFEDGILRVMGKARKYDVPVVLTFFSLGGGGNKYSGTDPSVLYQNGSVCAADFSGQTVGSTLTDWVRGTTVTWPAPASRDEKDWNNGTLDPTMEYKLVYIQHFAYYTARMLDRIALKFGATATDFGGGLVGIELFNELNTCNTYDPEDPEATGKMWAPAVAYALEGFIKGFASVPTTIYTSLPKFWWPSLASENKDQTLSVGVRPFHVGMVSEVVRLLGTSDASYLTNQDVHWYRFSQRQEVALAVEMIDVVNAVSNVFTDNGLSPTVSVSETGASATQDGTDVTYPAYVTGTTETLESFQAREVIRRLAVASCSGATRAGWHSHMGVVRESGAKGDSPFEGTGLRNDARYSTASAPNANEATARPSYWTYFRWQALLGGRRGFVVHPVVKKVAPAYHGLDRTTPEDSLVILQFPGYGVYLFCYLLFLDSAYDTTDKSASIDVRVTCAVGTRIYYVSLIPESTASTVPALAETFSFPVDTATWPASIGPETTTTTEFEATVALDEDPVLWYTDKPLIFTVPAP